MPLRLAGARALQTIQGGIHGNLLSGNDPEYINYDMLGEKRYAHTKGGVMGTSKYPKTNPKNYRMTKNSARRQPELHGHGSLAALEKL